MYVNPHTLSHQKKNTKSLGFKLSFIISLILFLVFTGKAVYDGINDYSTEVTQKTALLVEETSVLAKKLERIFSDVHQSLINLEGILQYELSLPREQRSRQRMLEYLQITVKKTSSLYGISMLFEPNAFDGNDLLFANQGFHKENGRFVPYASRTADGVAIGYSEGIEDYQTNDWYTRPMKEKRPVLFAPFEYEYQGEHLILTTIGIPIIHNGKVLGTMNADIDVSFLQKELETLPGTNKRQFKMLCTDLGLIVANGGDSSRILKNLIEEQPTFQINFDRIQQNTISEDQGLSVTSNALSKFIFVPVDFSGIDTHWAFISVNCLQSFTAKAWYTLCITIIQYVIILIAITVILTILVRNMVVLPLCKTNAILKDISQGEGDLTVRLPIHGHDEITELAVYFNQTIEKIGSSIKLVGVNTETMQSIGEELSSNMTQTAGAVHQISTNIDGVKHQTLTQAASVTETAATVEQIIRTIKQLNSSIEHQASSVVESSSAIEQMVANIVSITQTLEKTNDVIKTLASATEDGKSTIATSNKVTQQIAEESGGLLEASSVIQHIASQTNLLAMNAAIEAAHAGEAGKGFAVVADEIRKLAEESSMQGKAITATLKTLSGEIDTLSTSAKTVEEKFNIIFDLSEHVETMSAKLMEAMQEQEHGSQEVLAAIRDINAITSQVRDGSTEMLSGGENVAEEMKKLDTLTRVITESMNEMASSAVQISNAVHEVSEITQQNKQNIENLAQEVKKFKV